jgi:hypothetical protein
VRTSNRDGGLTLGFMIEGSTGARALAMLQAMPLGTIIETQEFAMALGVKPAALYQLLTNAVKLRLIKKVHKRGSPFIGWGLGAGNVGVTIEPRRERPPPPTDEEIKRRAIAAAARAARAAERAAASTTPMLPKPPAWPPGFVSTFDPGAVNARAFADTGRDFLNDGAPDSATGLPAWLAGPGPTCMAMRRRSAPPDQRCPASYLARWLVHYAGEGRQLHSVIRVQSIDPRGGRLKVWSELHQELQTIRWSGLRRAEDADRGRPIDLDAWWRKFRSKQSAPRCASPGQSGARAAEELDARVPVV